MVSTYIDLLNKRLGNSLAADTREFMGFATEGAKRMQSLINDLLEYSRIGREGIKLQQTNTGLLVDQVVKTMRGQIIEKKATVTWEKLPTVNCMPTALSQIFQNLIQNALKFQREQSPEINIAAHKKGKEWIFKVQDNGIGIDAEYRIKIFDLFRRLHSREKYEGTGIGLSICKKIVDMHGGRIWVESTPGQGSTFYFTLPA
jgi:light-regulated signal transduction histidine kinase (bacteriophytochrome)